MGCLTVAERLQGLRQFGTVWKDRSTDKDRNHTDIVSLKGSLNLQSMNVVWIIEAPASCLVNDRQPLGPDDHQHCRQLSECLLDDLVESLARID